jgi:tetraacyldisaccharide 4'-kinase
VYGCIIYFRNLLYDLGWFATEDFKLPIISVGNITTGGSGKTPLVMYLANLLIKNGKNPGIVSRGYGRKSQGLVVVHDGKEMKAKVESAGDEPFLMATILKSVPVIVCEDRREAIRHLVNSSTVNIIIMDDGFQHRKVKRDLDIIAISANDSKNDYRLLPWGKLREPFKNINRSNAIVFTKTDNFTPPNIHAEVQSVLKGSQFFSTMIPVLMKYDSSGYHKSLTPTKPLFAFCGIGEPDSFFKSIKQLDLKLGGKRIFSDHQEYTESVITELSAQIKSSNCAAIITTEKDLVKLSESFLDEFETFVIKIEMEFEIEGAVLDIIQPVLWK